VITASARPRSGYGVIAYSLSSLSCPFALRRSGIKRCSSNAKGAQLFQPPLSITTSDRGGRIIVQLHGWGRAAVASGIFAGMGNPRTSRCHFANVGGQQFIPVAVDLTRIQWQFTRACLARCRTCIQPALQRRQIGSGNRRAPFYRQKGRGPPQIALCKNSPGALLLFQGVAVQRSRSIPETDI